MSFFWIPTIPYLNLFLPFPVSSLDYKLFKKKIYIAFIFASTFEHRILAKQWEYLQGWGRTYELRGRTKLVEHTKPGRETWFSKKQEPVVIFLFFLLYMKPLLSERGTCKLQFSMRWDSSLLRDLNSMLMQFQSYWWKLLKHLDLLFLEGKGSVKEKYNCY